MRHLSKFIIGVAALVIAAPALALIPLESQMPYNDPFYNGRVTVTTAKPNVVYKKTTYRPATVCKKNAYGKRVCYKKVVR